MDKYFGHWDKNRLMKPSEFERTREIGEYIIELPKPPKKEEILNYNLPIKQQKFIPTKVPENIEEMPKSERLSFILQEMDRRNNGVFFYNRGAIEYLSGEHYFYLNSFPIDVGLPEFRDGDQRMYYIWDLCVKDENCYGLAYYTNRRSGKTWSGINIVYEYTSKTKESHSGIQSKTRGDAANIFRKLVLSWKKMNPLWKPTDSGETNPKTSINFEEPSKRSTKGERKTYKNVLNSMIDYMPSVEEAYDGYKLKRYYFDEFGKSVEIDAYKRWKIVKPCLEIGNKIIGKAYGTTTVEELEKKGGQAAVDIWNDSNPNERKGDGRTKSGLYRYFKPAYVSLEGFIDQWGYSDIEGAKTFLLSKREGLVGADLVDEMRKYPFTISEAFMMDSKTEMFPSYKIYEQMNFNETLPESRIRTGNFLWVDEGTKKEVRFVDDPKGRFNVTWMPPLEKQNNYTVKGTRRMPSNTHTGAFGVDPFDHKTTVDNRRSNAACYGVRDFDILDPFRSYAFVVEYVSRPPTPEMFYEDMIKACVFYGWKILVENQKPGLINYMSSQGFAGYVMRTNHADLTKNGSNRSVEGISLSGQIAREALVNGLQTYIYDYVGKIEQKKQIELGGSEYIEGLHGTCLFDTLLSDWLKFDPNDWTVHDPTVGSGVALLAIKNQNKRKKIIADDFENESPKKWFETYRTVGGRSVRSGYI